MHFSSNITKFNNNLKHISIVPFVFVTVALFFLIYNRHSPEITQLTMVNKNTMLKSGEIKHQVANLSIESQFISQPSFLPAAHAATIEVLPNGDLLAAWFAGSHEGRPDVKIWQSRYSSKNWSEAVAIVTPELVTIATNSYVKKLGNPVLYLDNNGVMHLFVVSVGFVGGWSASNIQHFISNDYGKNWGFKAKLVLSPFFNLSTLVRTKAITLSDGGFYLPVYHELIYTYPMLLRFNKSGEFVEEMRMSSNNDLLQPALLPITNTKVFGYLRNKALHNENLYYQVSDNAGMNWQEAAKTNLTNHDSSIATAYLKDGLYLMLHNNTDRHQLWLASSKDGINWSDQYAFESANSGNSEFSYPAIQVHDDLIDILYTYNRNKIKHLRLHASNLYDFIMSAKHVD